MLRTVDIQNIVLIDRVTLDLAPGFGVLSGETGAGKSILLDALGLLRGDRADAGLLRKGTPQGGASAVFDVAPEHPVREILSGNGVVIEDEIVLRRTLSADGKSRAFINDQPVTVALLKTVGTALIDLHGQFETQNLFDPAVHRDMLDSFARLAPDREKTAQTWAAWKKAQRELDDARAGAEQARRDEDYLRETVSALRDLSPQEGEEDHLLARRLRLQNRAAIAEGLSQALEGLQGDKNGAEQGLAAAARVLDRLRSKLTGPLEDWMAGIDTALIAVREVGAGIEREMAGEDEEGENLESLEDRLHDLRAMARRLGCAPADLIARRQEMEEKLRRIDHGTAGIRALEETLEKARGAYLAAAEKLHEARAKEAKKLDSAVMKELPPLKLDKARFETAVEKLPENQAGPMGIDQIRFRVAMNSGQDPAPMDKVASGGELSRLMLALKVVLAGAGPAPAVRIFDEVDSGLGGAVAAAVGERLARLSSGAQVLAVTHAPQVAAFADHHWVVHKTGAGGVVNTGVKYLEPGSARREEIARMLSGETITDEARAAADKLLELRVA